MDLVTVVERLLPTPMAQRSGRNQSASDGAAIRHSLDQISQLLPTPTASDANGSGAAGYSTATRNSGTTLTDALARGLGAMPKPDTTDVDWGDYEPAVRRWEHHTRPAPRPTNDKGQLAPELPEWMMGLDDGHVTNVPGITRRHALGIIGNGVCPQQAALAITELTT